MMQKISHWSGVFSATLILMAVIAGFLQPGYDSIAQTVSEMASPGQPGAFYFRMGFFLSGMSLVTFSRYLKYRAGKKSKWLWLSMGLIGLFTILGSIFTIDTGSPQSLNSIIHIFSGLMLMILTAVAFIAMYQIEKVYCIKVSRVLLITGLIGWAGIMMTVFYSEFAGLGQRIFYIGFTGFLVYVTLAMEWIIKK